MTAQRAACWSIAAFCGLTSISPGRAEDDLSRLVEEHFHVSKEQRPALVRRIERAANGDFTQVATAVRSARLWAPLPQRGTWTTELSQQRSVQIVYQLPEIYDPAIAWPAVICMPERAAAAADVLRVCQANMPNEAKDMVRIVPTLAVGGAFTLDHPAADGDLETMLVAIRRRIHTDGRRTYLFGKADGGDAAWVALLTQPEFFSHAAIVCPYPPLPCMEHLLPLLAENLRNIRPVAEAPDKETAGGRVLTILEPASNTACRSAGVDGEIRPELSRAVSIAFAEYARRMGLPVDRTGDDPSDSGPLHFERLSEKLPFPDELSLWFRYPGLGRIGWLKQTRWEGPVWDAEALSIRPAAATDRDAFVTGVLKDHMGYLGGRKEGKTLHVETRRCAEIELRVPDSWDLSQPLTIIINGRKRFEGMIEPSIATLLESAAERWDTRDLIVATRRFRISPP